VLVNLAPYWELRAFESGDNVTVTGDPSQYFNLLLEGTVHIFVPRNEEAFQTSIRLRNSKSKEYEL
jgi:signal-transduction protein with cAMP-binding, CBS, and nucleotidyltransferase domain